MKTERTEQKSNNGQTHHQLALACQRCIQEMHDIDIQQDPAGKALDELKQQCDRNDSIDDIKIKYAQIIEILQGYQHKPFKNDDLNPVEIFCNTADAILNFKKNIHGIMRDLNAIPEREWKSISGEAPLTELPDKTSKFIETLNRELKSNYGAFPKQDSAFYSSACVKKLNALQYRLTSMNLEDKTPLDDLKKLRTAQEKHFESQLNTLQGEMKKYLQEEANEIKQHLKSEHKTMDIAKIGAHYYSDNSKLMVRIQQYQAVNRLQKAAEKASKDASNCDALDRWKKVYDNERPIFMQTGNSRLTKLANFFKSIYYALDPRKQVSQLWRPEHTAGVREVMMTVKKQLR